MLPDFPEEKLRLQELVIKRMEAVTARRMHVFGSAPASILFEGIRYRLVRDDGSVDCNDLRSVEASITVDFDEAESLSIPELCAKADQAALSIADQQMKLVIESLDQAIEQSGNVLNHKGVTPDAFLEMLDRIEFSFDEMGNPHLPSLMSGPSVAPKIEAMLREIENSPTLTKRYDSIIDQQRERWRVRESNRKLVG
jgi:hypothetical protein